MNLEKAKKYFWLSDYLKRWQEFNKWADGQGWNVWLENVDLCWGNFLYTEPFRDNLPPNCITEIDRVIESRDRALKKILADALAPSIALETLSTVPTSLRSHDVFKTLASDPPFQIDKANLYLITNWVVLIGLFDETGDDAMLVPGLAFHKDGSRADAVNFHARSSLTEDGVRKRWERLKLVPVTEKQTPNLVKLVGGKMTLRCKSKKHS